MHIACSSELWAGRVTTSVGREDFNKTSLLKTKRSGKHCFRTRLEFLVVGKGETEWLKFKSLLWISGHWQFWVPKWNKNFFWKLYIFHEIDFVVSSSLQVRFMEGKGTWQSEVAYLSKTNRKKLMPAYHDRSHATPYSQHVREWVLLSTPYSMYPQVTHT